MRMMMALLAAGLLLPPMAFGQSSHGGAPASAAPGAPDERSAEARARYPQPVRVGDLLGRQVLEDVPQQRVLGHVAGVVRDAQGQVSILVDCCSFFGFGGRRVALPVGTMTVLGPFMVARDDTAETLERRPIASPGAGELLAADATIRVGLGRN